MSTSPARERSDSRSEPGEGGDDRLSEARVAAFLAEAGAAPLTRTATSRRSDLSLRERFGALLSREGEIGLAQRAG